MFDLPSYGCAVLQAYRTLVGREYRIVHQLDIVPSLPPTNDYRHVGLGIWELDGQVNHCILCSLLSLLLTQSHRQACSLSA